MSRLLFITMKGVLILSEIYDKIEDCLKSIRKITDFVPKAAIVLGSGLGDYADSIRVVAEIEYKDIKGFPVSTVPGHAGKFIFVGLLFGC